MKTTKPLDDNIANLGSKDDATLDDLSSKRGTVVVTMKSETSIDNNLLVPELSARSRARSVSRSVSTTSSLGLSSWYPGQKFMEKGRSKWPSHIDSLLASIGTAVGLSNIYGFPILAYRNGGVLFFIPYLICTAILAFPILYQDLILGQFVQQGSISVWKIVPIFKGVGHAIHLVGMMTLWYYPTALTWSMVYLFESLNTTLSYTRCDNEWNTRNCIVPSLANYNTKGNNTNYVSAGTEYFRGRVLRLWPSKYSDGDAEDDVLIDIDTGVINHTIFGFNTKLGSPIWDLSVCMFLIYCGYFLVIIYGIRLSRRISWVCILPPYIVLPILLFRGITLTGARTGLAAFGTQHFSVLATPEPWIYAAVQCLFSTGAGTGYHVTIGSHNNFKQDCFRDALWTCIVDTFVSMMATAVMFCYIGEAANIQSVSVKDVVGNLTDGSDLLFELFPDVVGSLSGGRFFLILFFLMILLMGYNTTVPLYQSVTMGYSDELTKWFPSNTNSEQILNFALTAWSFVFSLICCTRGGIWVYKFMKIYSGGVSLVLSVFAELLVVSWIWGLEDLCNAAEAMTGRKPGLFLRLCWKIFSPLSLMGIASLLYIDITKSEMKYNGEIAPKSVHVAGNILTCIPLIIIPIYVIYQLFYSKADTFALKMRLLFYPENEHHDIRRGRFPTERYTSGHIFYIGWNVVCRKKRTTKPKIHPADPAIIVTETSKSLFDTQKIDSNENTNDNPGTDTDKSKSEPPVQDKFETVEVPVTEKKITSKHVSNKQPRPSTDPGSEIVPENNGENPIKVSRKSGTIKKKPKSHPR